MRGRFSAFKNAPAICMDVFCDHIGRKLRAGFHPGAENGKISVETGKDVAA